MRDAQIGRVIFRSVAGRSNETDSSLMLSRADGQSCAKVYQTRMDVTLNFPNRKIGIAKLLSRGIRSRDCGAKKTTTEEEKKKGEERRLLQQIGPEAFSLVSPSLELLNQLLALLRMTRLPHIVVIFSISQRGIRIARGRSSNACILSSGNWSLARGQEYLSVLGLMRILLLGRARVTALCTHATRKEQATRLTKEHS